VIEGLMRGRLVGSAHGKEVRKWRSPTRGGKICGAGAGGGAETARVGSRWNVCGEVMGGMPTMRIEAGGWWNSKPCNAFLRCLGWNKLRHALPISARTSLGQDPIAWKAEEDNR
jgi:hypothetical protein